MTRTRFLPYRPMNGYVLVDGVLCKVNEMGSSSPEPTPPTPTPSWGETTIGDQTWANENLAYDDGGEGILIVPNVTVNGVNFGTQYYYRSDAAMRLYKNWSNLPFKGWHIATQDDGSLLQNYVGEGDPFSLMTTSGWNDGMNGNNLNGFNGAPIGCYWDNEGEPEPGDLGDVCEFWLYANGSEVGDDFDNYMYFSPYGISHEGFDVNKWWFPIRLVKDSE